MLNFGTIQKICVIAGAGVTLVGSLFGLANSEVQMQNRIDRAVNEKMARLYCEKEEKGETEEA